jgi:hypothetical protein
MWPFGLHGYRRHVMGAKVVTSLLCWPTGNGEGGWTLVARGQTAINAFKRAGWIEISNSLDIRYADVSDVRQSEIRRFQDWRQAWEQDDGA